MVPVKTVLVVDDDQDIVDSITMILESAGYAVLTADSGRECVQLLQREYPDLIILDIMMETLTEGISLSESFAGTPAMSGIPILMVSTIEDFAGLPIERAKLHIADFLEKPFDPRDMLARVRALVEG